MNAAGDSMEELYRRLIREELAAFEERLIPMINAIVAHPPPAEDRLVDVHEAARLVNMRHESLQRRAARGSLPPGTVVRHGRRVLYRVRALLGHPAPAPPPAGKK